MTSVWVGSPNYTMGRPVKIDRIVIHWIVGNLSAADATFQNTRTKTSAHYGIENTTVHQYVRDNDTAWHAGTAPMNARSIGIEHSAAPGRNATASTIDTSARLVADLCRKHNIPCDRTHIIKHSQVVATQCPGTIPIDTIISKANVYLKGGNVAIIANNKAWKARAQKSFRMIRNRNMSDREFTPWVGKDFLKLIEALQDNKEANQAYADQQLGKKARTDSWEHQIYSLQDKLKAVQTALKQANAALDNAKQQYDIKGDLAKQLEASQHKNDQLIAQLEELKAEKTTRDEAVNSLWTTIGDFLNKLLGR